MRIFYICGNPFFECIRYFDYEKLTIPLDNIRYFCYEFLEDNEFSPYALYVSLLTGGEFIIGSLADAEACFLDAGIDFCEFY